MFRTIFTKYMALLTVPCLIAGCVTTTFEEAHAPPPHPAHYSYSNHDGSSQEEAVIIKAYNAISGDIGEQDWIQRKYPKSKIEEGISTESNLKHFHIFKLILSDGTKKTVYIDATNYYGIF